MTIENSTISGNSAEFVGGGVYQDSHGSAAVLLRHVTIASNSATQGGGVYDGSSSVTESHFIVNGSVVAENTAAGPDAYALVTSQGHNLIGNGSGSTGFTNGVNGDQVGADGSPLNPFLGPLDSNGGATKTHALLAGSPAINTAGLVDCPATDQRGVSRPQGVACDVGAFELGQQYAFTGFFSPLDNLPTLNVIKAGSAIPVKFRLNGNQGLAVLASGSPSSQTISCNAAAPQDAVIETVAAGGSSLSYDAVADLYTYVWKTDKAWAGTCRELVVTLADNTAHRANFRFAK